MKDKIKEAAEALRISWLTNPDTGEEVVDLIEYAIKSEAARGYWDRQGWVRVEDGLPKEGGRYWCYCISVGELGVSGFQWNCAYNPNTKTFHDFAYSFKDGEWVTHWRPLPAPPNQ